ncbi:hypothetical protein ALP29_02857 [Pseudomonas syringae pv. avii]|uniref:Uncharacterized protein n=1 Tax=Pseudomonas syringae pv. avii TaxID=663959 RepID=A0A3M5VDQ9_PSESX|nr:hypothetical protein ALP29_02857 [Pseudomonas syringae pv. avii]
MTQDGLLIFAPAIVNKLSSSVPIQDASSPTACSRAFMVRIKMAHRPRYHFRPFAFVRVF